MHEMQTVAIDDPSCLSVCLSCEQLFGECSLDGAFLQLLL